MTHQTTYLPRHTNHGLHAILTFATCGAWGFVWLAVILWNAVTKDKVTTVTSHPRAWYQHPVARPYEVGPEAAVGPMNPSPATRPVPMPPMPPYVGYRPGWDHVDMAHPPARPQSPPDPPSRPQ